jgi:hypothetical protein
MANAAQSLRAGHRDDGGSLAAGRIMAADSGRLYAVNAYGYARCSVEALRPGAR